jgi:thymidylate kinase
VREGYHALAAAEPERWAIVDANQPPERVQAAVREIVSARLERERHI